MQYIVKIQQRNPRSGIRQTLATLDITISGDSLHPLPHIQAVGIREANRQGVPTARSNEYSILALRGVDAASKLKIWTPVTK